MIHCEPCGHKKIIQENEDVSLVECPLSSVPSGAPKKDSTTKKVETKKSIERNKMYKCPQCGRGVITKTLPDAYVTAYKKEEELKIKQEDEKRKQIQLERMLKEKEIIGEEKEDNDT